MIKNSGPLQATAPYSANLLMFKYIFIAQLCFQLTWCWLDVNFLPKFCARMHSKQIFEFILLLLNPILHRGKSYKKRHKQYAVDWRQRCKTYKSCMLRHMFEILIVWMNLTALGPLGTSGRCTRWSAQGTLLQCLEYPLSGWIWRHSDHLARVVGAPGEEEMGDCSVVLAHWWPNCRASYCYGEMY